MTRICSFRNHGHASGTWRSPCYRPGGMTRYLEQVYCPGTPRSRRTSSSNRSCNQTVRPSFGSSHSGGRPSYGGRNVRYRSYGLSRLRLLACRGSSHFSVDIIKPSS